MMGNSASLGPGLPYPGPCILFAVVESTGRARQTGSGPGPPRPQEALGSSRLSFGKERARTVARASPRQTRREPASARTGHKTKEVPHMVDARTEAYAGVDVFQGALRGLPTARPGGEGRRGL